MKIHYLILIGVFLLSSITCVCQSDRNPTDEEIRQRTADSIAKNSFGKMVAGTEDVSNLSNYVSFVPTDGKFTLSGNYFFEKSKKDTSKKRRVEYFAVGFNGSGSIVGGNVATLFESGKLNTGIDLGLKLSWRMNKPNVGSLESESVTMIEKRSALEAERQQKIDSVKNDLQLISLKLQKATLSIAKSKISLSTFSADTTRLKDSIRKCTTDTCRLKFLDSLLTAKANILAEIQKISQLERDTIRLQEIYEVSQIKAGTDDEHRTERQKELASKYGLNRIDLTYEDTLINKIRNEYEDKIYAVEAARPIAGMRLNWLSAIINWNRISYRTYYDSLPFENALTKEKSTGLTIGLQANFYTFYKPVRRACLFNFALLFKQTNNLEDLTTSKLTDEVVVSNGTTERKSSTEYNVYTDPIESYSTIQLPANYYRFFGKNLTFGWHVFALADWRINKKSVYDAGTGFIFGLNSSETKKLFNIELFVKYKDITQKLITDEEDKNAWNQLQFGLSVAIPFMIYKN